MSEYDNTPAAIQERLAKQPAIAKWVEETKQHNLANPFTPLAEEHAPSEASYHPHRRSQPQLHHPTSTAYPHHGQYPSQSVYHDQGQSYLQHPTSYDYGVATPKSAPPKRHRHNHNSMPAPLAMSAPMSTEKRSRSMPPMARAPVNGMMVPMAMTSTDAFVGYPAFQHQLLPTTIPQLTYASPQTMAQPQLQYGYPYQSHPGSAMVPGPAPVVISPSSPHSHSHSRSKSKSRSKSRPSSFHSGDSPRSPISPHSPYEESIYQPRSNQPMLVPIHGGTGGYVIVPPGRDVRVIMA